MTTKLRTLCLLLLFPALAQAAPAADLWPYWNVSDETSQEIVDHSAWSSILQRHVITGDDGINRVDYTTLGQPTHRQPLTGYLQYLSSLDPQKLTRAEQFAYWVNLYNAATVEVVLNHPDKTSIRRMGAGFFSSGPWDDTILTITGKKVSLNDIEHRILRPLWRDHRIHFAVNCASLGCPNLHREAFTAANTERLLKATQANYLAHPRGITIDGERIVASSIFDWYQEDFGASEAELVRYLARQHPGVARYRQTHPKPRFEYAYDWSLNSVNQR